jgi:DNA-binding beta-propeller fold protein YncE
VAVSPNGQRVYIANFDNALKRGSLKVASTVNNDITESVPIGKGSWGVTVGPYGKRVYVSRFGDDKVSVLEHTESFKPAGNLPDLVGKVIGGASVRGPRCCNAS